MRFISRSGMILDFGTYYFIGSKRAMVAVLQIPWFPKF